MRQVTSILDVGLTDPEEPYFHPLFNPDPNHDKWYFEGNGKCPFRPDSCDMDEMWEDESIRYEFLNSTEGNLTDLYGFHEPHREYLGESDLVMDNA